MTTQPTYKTVLVSAGHGGSDPGAVSTTRGLREADLALRLRDQVIGLLHARGVPTFADGRTGQNLPLTDALALARKTAGPRVEFHFNSGPPTATGVEALSLGAHKPLAQALAKAVSGATGLFARGDQGWKPDSAGQHHRLAFCQAGGVVLELAFISNDDDLKSYFGNELLVAERLAAVLAWHARR